MASGRLLLSWLYILGLQHCSLVGARTPGPWPLNFNNTKGVGPDGPWRVVTIGVGFPDQFCDVYPGGQGATVLVAREVCQQQNLTCPSPPPLLYNPDDIRAHPGKSNPSGDIVPRQWDSSRAQALNMMGNACYHSERVFLRDARESYYAENTSVLVSSSFAMQYPGGTRVPLSVGLLGMGGPNDTVRVNLQNGSTANFPTLLGSAASEGIISSRSWGLHIGSVRYGINGSLVFGGYDQSRILGDIATYDGETTRILSISTRFVDRGASSEPLPGWSPDRGPPPNHLSRPMEALLDASVPYMFLPAAVCESMAQTLPLTFDPGLQLYLWDGKNGSYGSMVNSSSHISFQFSDARNKDVTIRVPLALLNLTLESPLVTEPTPYFPCRPIPAGDQQPFRLGRAFLQAAFIARNWESGKFYVAQAPGPIYREPDIKRISRSDTTLTPPLNPPEWNSTWASVLGPTVSIRSNSTQDPSSPRDRSATSTHQRRTSVSVGVAVSVTVVFSVAATITVLCLLLRRRRRQQQRQSEQGHAIDKTMVEGLVEAEAPTNRESVPGVGEMPGQHMAHEADSQESCDVGDGRKSAMS